MRDHCKQWDGRPDHKASIVPEWKVRPTTTNDGGVQVKVTAMGIDLAKNVFQVHGVDERGRVVLRKQLRRAQVMSFFAQRTPCLVGMEACGGAHEWARRLTALGFKVGLMAPQFVKPYVKSNKNDAADAEAEAICEAVTRPNMRFVPIKTPDQQAILALHRARKKRLSTFPPLRRRSTRKQPFLRVCLGTQLMMAKQVKTMVGKTLPDAALLKCV